MYWFGKEKIEAGHSQEFKSLKVMLHEMIPNDDF